MGLSRSVATGTLAMVLSLGAHSATGQVQYDLTILSGMSDNGFTAPAGLNDAGLIVGLTSPRLNGRLGATGSRPILWHDNKPRVLAPFPGFFGFNNAALDVNAEGVIAGAHIYPGAPDPFVTHAARWVDGHFEHLGALPGDADARATAINNAGVIVGRSGPDFFTFASTHAFRYENGVMEELPALPGAFDAAAADINEADLIVGSSGNFFGLPPSLAPVMWDAGVITELPLPAGADAGEASAVNNTGVVVGRAGTADPMSFDPLFFLQPARWSAGSAEFLPLLPGDDFGFAADVNDDGVIVGVSGARDPDFGFIVSQRAVVWIDGNAIDLAQAAGMPAEWTTVFANAINSRGQIVGSGSGNLDRDPFFFNVPFVLDPVPDCDPCDVNCDDAVDALDVGALVALLNDPGAARCSPCAGDANGDGTVDAMDIGAILSCKRRN